MKKDMKHSVAKAFEFPGETLLNLPLISITGNEEMVIENFKGIIEYGKGKVRINTSAGVISIEGNELLLKHISGVDLLITGNLKKIEFLI